MKELTGRVAVVTGGASGIGFGIATAVLQRGGHAVLMDRDIAGAVESAKKLEPLYPNSVIMTVEADVSDSESVLAAADAIFDRFNTIHLLCNNAGVSSVGQLWDTPLTDWHTVWSVNLMGAVHGLRAFVSRMLEVGEDGHVVNTSSLGGLLAVPLKAPYVAAKHALVGLSQNSRAEFRMIHAPIGVTVVCPGPVATGIIDKQRDRYDGPTQISEAGQEVLDQLKDAVDNGMPAEEAGEIILSAVGADRFWVFPNPVKYLDVVESDFQELHLDSLIDIG